LNKKIFFLLLTKKKSEITKLIKKITYMQIGKQNYAHFFEQKKFFLLLTKKKCEIIQFLKI